MSGSRPRHDVWRHGDLGSSGWLIYEQLSGDLGASSEGLANLTGLSVRTVRRRLRALENRGLVTRDPSGRWTRGEREPSECAATGNGKAQRDRQLYTAERAAYEPWNKRDGRGRPGLHHRPH